jgi:hypothetical protein
MLHVDLNLTPDTETQLLRLINQQFQGSFEAFIQTCLKNLLSHKEKIALTPEKIKTNTLSQHNDDALFGIWADREDMPSVEEYIRNLRKNRVF